MITPTEYISLMAEHRELLTAYRVLNERYHALLEEAVKREPVTFSSGPLHLSEDEEDAKYALDAGHIDQQLYNDLLAQAKFDNTEIEVH